MAGGSLSFGGLGFRVEGLGLRGHALVGLRGEGVGFRAIQGFL